MCDHPVVNQEDICVVCGSQVVDDPVDPVDSRPYRKNNDPASSHEAAARMVEREGGSRTIRKGSHKDILLTVYVKNDRASGLTLQEAAQIAIEVSTEFKGQIPKRDAARRAEDIAKMGLLNKLSDGSHYRVNDLGFEIRKRLLQGEKQVVV